MDACLFAHDAGIAPADVAAALALSEEQVVRVFKDIVRKRAATRYLHEPPLLVEPARGT
jgi:NAD+ synthase